MHKIKPFNKNPSNNNIPYAQLVGELENFMALFAGRIDDDQNSQEVADGEGVRIACENRRLNKALEQSSQFFEAFKSSLGPTINLFFSNNKNEKNEAKSKEILDGMIKISGLESFKKFKNKKKLSDKELKKITETLESVISEKIEISYKIREISSELGAAREEKKQIDFDGIIVKQIEANKKFSVSLSVSARKLFEEKIDELFEKLRKSINRAKEQLGVVRSNLISGIDKDSNIIDLSNETLESISNKRDFLEKGNNLKSQNDILTDIVTPFIKHINESSKKQAVLSLLKNINFYDANKPSKNEYPESATACLEMPEDELEKLEKEFFASLLDDQTNLVKDNQETIKKDESLELSYHKPSNEEVNFFAPALPPKNIQEAIKEINSLESERLELSYLKNEYLKPLQDAAERVVNIENIITDIIKNEESLYFIPDALVSELQIEHSNAVKSFFDLKNKFEEEKEFIRKQEEKEKENLNFKIDIQQKQIDERIKIIKTDFESICYDEKNRLGSDRDELTKNYINQLSKKIEDLVGLSRRIPAMIKNAGENLHLIKDAFNYITKCFSELKEEINGLVRLWDEVHRKLEYQKIEEVHQYIQDFQKVIDDFETTLAKQKELCIQSPKAYSHEILEAAKFEANEKGFYTKFEGIGEELKSIKATTLLLLDEKNFRAGKYEDKKLLSGEKKEFLDNLRIGFKSFQEINNETLLKYGKEVLTQAEFFSKELPSEIERMLTQINQRIDALNVAKNDGSLKGLHEEIDVLLGKLKQLKEVLNDTAAKGPLEKKIDLMICQQKFSNLVPEMKDLLSKINKIQSTQPSWFGSSWPNLFPGNQSAVPRPQRQNGSAPTLNK